MEAGNMYEMYAVAAGVIGGIFLLWEEPDCCWELWQVLPYGRHWRMA